MELAALVVAIVLVVILVRRVTAPFGVPTPLALLVVGAVLSFVPGVPEVRLSSELVLYGLLPPLLYAAALGTSLLDVKAQPGRHPQPVGRAGPVHGGGRGRRGLR